MRLGRSLASLIGEGERPERRGRRPAQRRARCDQGRALQPEAEFLRSADRGACGLDPRARSGAAARGAPGRAASMKLTRSSPASGAGAPRSAPSCTRFRSSCARSAINEAIEIAIIENVQREDLNAVEEAEGYRLLMDGHGYTQEDLVQGHRQEPQPSRQHPAAAQAA